MGEDQGHTEITAKYGYQQAYPPLLTSIDDGRLDASGQSFDWANFAYEGSAFTDYKVTSSAHFGGADGYTFADGTATNSLGHTTNYSFEEVLGQDQITQVDGVATPHCLATTKSVSYTPGPNEPEGLVYERLERNGSVTKYTRNDRGLTLTKIEDANGFDPRVTTYTWHPDLHLPLTRTTDEMVETFVYDYTRGERMRLETYTQTDNIPSSPTFGQSRTWNYYYTLQPDGASFNTGNENLTMVDGPGLTSDGVRDFTIYEYNDDSLLVKTTDPNGLVTEVLSFTKQGQPSLVRMPDGVEWGFTYDHRGRVLTSTFDPNGPAPKSASFTYDIIGQMLSATDMLGRTTTFEYDEARRLVKTTNPAGEIAEYEYDLMGNQTRMSYSTPGGSEKFWERTEFDELGRVLKTIGAANQQWQFTHDVEDNLDTITDPTSQQITHGFDALNRLVETVDRRGHTTSMEHNDADQVTKYTDPRIIDTDFAYNGFGEVLTEVSQDKGTTSYTYNNRGLVTSITDGNGVLSTYEYDHGGRLTAGRLPSDPSLDEEYSYATSNIVIIPTGELLVNGDFEDTSNGTGNSTTPAGWTKTGHGSGVISGNAQRSDGYSFALGGYSHSIGQTLRQTVETHPGQTYELNFDGGAYFGAFSGHLLVEAGGIELGQYTAADLGGSLSPFSIVFLAVRYQTELVFTFNGSPGSGSDVDLDNVSLKAINIQPPPPQAPVHQNGKLTLVSDGSGSIARDYATDTGYLASETRTIEGQAYALQYDHDIEGNLTSMTYPSGAVVSYTRDGLDRPVQVSIDLGAGPQDIIAAGTTYYPNGALKSMTYGDGAIHTATYDHSYRLIGLNDDLGGTALRDIDLAWSARDNLIAVTNQLDTLDNRSFTYTAREFLQDADGPWGQKDFTYDPVGNRLSETLASLGTTTTDTYSYPATSNRLQSVAGGQSRAFTYDAAGNTTYDNRSGTGFGYGYNAKNRLESVSINGMVQSEFAYNALGQQVIRRLTVGGQTIHSVHDADGNRVAEYDYDPGTQISTLLREYVWMNGENVAVVEGGVVYYVRTDHIGRPVFATDDSGTKVWEASYLPFGGVHTSTGANSDLRFPGQWFQSEAGLHQNWMRDYDPTTGRYIQADPLGLVDGASVYGYVRQNPMRYSDPTGLCPWCVYAAGGAAVGVVYGYLTDEDGCYTVGEALFDAAVGAVAGGAVGVAAKAARAAKAAKAPKGSANGPRAGKRHTRGAIKEAVRRNAAKNNGDVRCTTCGVKTTKPTRRTKGSKVNPREAQGDHIVARSKGGNGATVKDQSNIDIKCAKCNNIKSNK